jgi:dTDP-4-dehydrorhamnose reductase
MSERLLVVGGTGMLGHRLVLEASPLVETWWTARGDATLARRLLPMERCRAGIDLASFAQVAALLADVRPTAVVNCAGAVKQRSDVGAAEMIRANALFPHELADACDAVGARLVHLSTDCVFSGAGGPRPHGYTESDPPDAADLYGRSKLLGEVVRPGHLTIRTSMVGPELARHTALLDWFLRAESPVPGYRHARFSGLTTPALSRLLLRLAFEHRGVEGLFHLAGPAIDKYRLLMLLRDCLRPDVAVEPDDAVHVDRRLDGRRMAAATSLEVPSWTEMIEELAALVRISKGES